jgi:hypothetical protein
MSFFFTTRRQSQTLIAEYRCAEQIEARVSRKHQFSASWGFACVVLYSFICQKFDTLARRSCSLLPYLHPEVWPKGYSRAPLMPPYPGYEQA